MDTSSGADLVRGLGGNDQIALSEGNDLYDGGNGLDVLRYQSNEDERLVTTEQFTLTIDTSMLDLNQQDSGWTLSIPGLGVNELENIERIEVDTTRLAIDLDGAAGQTVKIIAAFFGASELSNAQLIRTGLSLFDAGETLESVAALAIDALGLNSNAALVDVLYSNLFGQLPTPSQAQQYVDLLESGVFTRASLAAAAAELTDEMGVIDLVGLAQSGIAYS